MSIWTYDEPARPDCELRLRIAEMKFAASQDHEQLKNIESIEALARLDPHEARQILGMPAKTKTKITTAEVIVAALFIVIVALVVSYEKDVDHLKSRINDLEIEIENLGGSI